MTAADSDAARRQRVLDALAAGALGVDGVWYAARERAPKPKTGKPLRDEIFRHLARKFFEGQSCRGRAAWLDYELGKYETSQWQFERELAECPHSPGTLRAGLWHALKADPSPTPGFERLRAILSTNGAGLSTGF